MKITSFIFWSFLILFCSCSSKFETKDTKSIVEQFDSIRLISYSTARVYENKLIINDSSVTISGVKFIDDLFLRPDQKNEIIDIIQTHTSNECMNADCYDPRHLLLFYKDKKIIGHYEICVSCGASMKSENIDLVPLCNETANNLIKMFERLKLKNNGIEGENYQYF